MKTDFELMLQKYADLTLKVGLNLQPGQRLLIVDLPNHGVSMEAAPFVRKIVDSAYRQGARYVDVMWSDETTRKAHFLYGDKDTFTELPLWMANDLLDHVQSGNPLLTISARDPDLLKGQDSELIGLEQQTRLRTTQPAIAYVERNAINWCVVGASAPGWAAKVFPDLPSDQAVTRLWEAIFHVCLVDQEDPVAAWQAHVRDLTQRRDYLNHKQYASLRYHSPDTDLTIGLPQEHRWASAQMPTEKGILFTANLPTEEVFTLPHREQVNGYARVMKPVSPGGVMIEDIFLRFENGRAVEARASKNEAVLQKLISTDEGAAHLGEVSLVAHSSPVSQSGILFYNILFDENAASHVALGAAYPFNLQGGEGLSVEQFAARGGNSSALHVDLMIGSAEMDVDGILPSGMVEPVMRQGEWAFQV
jgi:aminopeptidase